MSQCYERLCGRRLLSFANCSQTSRFKVSSRSSTGMNKFHTRRLTLHLLLISSCSLDCVVVNPSSSARTLSNYTQFCPSTQQRRSYLSRVLSMLVFPVEGDGDETISRSAPSFVCVNLLEVHPRWSVPGRTSTARLVVATEDEMSGSREGVVELPFFVVIVDSKVWRKMSRRTIVLYTHLIRIQSIAEMADHQFRR